MALTKDKKKALVKSLDTIVKDAETIVFVAFHKLGVEQSTKLRQALRNEKVGYTVAKKTLLKRALDSAKYEGELPKMDGEIAIAYGKDLLAPAREIYAFQKDHKDNMSIVGGVFEGKYINAEKMMSIATIPGMQVLYGQFVNLINSPIQGLVVGLKAIADKKAASN